MRSLFRKFFGKKENIGLPAISNELELPMGNAQTSLHSSEKLHPLVVSAETILKIRIASWYEIGVLDLDQIAAGLLGNRSNGWVRRNDKPAIIASMKRGSLASKLDEELLALSIENRKILAAAGENSALRAAVYYHLRFENIHPLIDGNGRVGRVILAAQLHQAYGISVEETLRQINAHQNDYMMVFPSNEPVIMFELMLDVIARLTGRTVLSESIKLPASILPLYPDRRPLIHNTAQPGKATVPKPKKQPRGGNSYYRKFH